MIPGVLSFSIGTFKKGICGHVLLMKMAGGMVKFTCFSIVHYCYLWLHVVLVLTNYYVPIFVGMAASQPNKATMKGVEEKDGEGEMPGWWEKAVKKVREDEAAAVEKKKQKEFEERQKEKWRMTFQAIDMENKLKKKCEIAEEKRLKDWREKTEKLWAFEAAKKEREHKRFMEKVVHEASLIRKREEEEEEEERKKKKGKGPGPCSTQ